MMNIINNLIRCEPDEYRAYLPVIELNLCANKLTIAPNHTIRMVLPLKENPIVLYPQINFILTIQDNEYRLRAKLNSAFYSFENMNVHYSLAGATIETENHLTPKDEISKLFIDKNINFRLGVHLSNGHIELLESETEISVLSDELEFLLKTCPSFTGQGRFTLFDSRYELEFNFSIIKISKNYNESPPISTLNLRIFSI